jgi:hypothetical protein
MVCLFRCVDAVPSIAREILIRIPALAILTTVAVLTAAPTLAQTYSPDYPVCLQAYRWGEATTNAAITRWRSGPCRHRAAAPYASSINILRARKCPGNHIIGGIVASTKFHLAAACLIYQA